MKHGIAPAAVFLAAALAVSSAGCGTIASRNEASPDWETTVYSGVVTDASFVAAWFQNGESTKLLISPFMVLDLPLSFVADTVLLPWTIPEQFGQRRKEVEAFVAAIEADDLAAAQAVARRTPEVLSVRLHERDTPLHLAVEKGQPDLVEWLAKDAAKDDAENLGNATPLGLATKAGRVDLARILLDAGADPNHASASDTPLHLAAALEDTALAELLTERGAAPNATNHWKETPLHVAAGHDRAAMAELLLARGADAGARDSFGRTPLHAAAAGGHVEVARVLLAHGADVNARSWSLDKGPLGPKTTASTPLGDALSHRRTEMAVLLRAQGAVE